MKTIMGLLLMFIVLAFNAVNADAAAKISVARWSDASVYQLGLDSAKAYLMKQGYEFPKVIHNFQNGDAKAQPIIQAILAEKPDLIFSFGTATTATLKKVIKDIPIVFSIVYDPVAAGLVLDRMKPRANVTGVQAGLSPMVQLKTLLKSVKVKRLGAILNPKEGGVYVACRKTFLIACKKYGVKGYTIPATTKEEYKEAFSTLIQDHNIDCLVGLDATAGKPDYNQLMSQLAIQNKLPFMGLNNNSTKGGALLSVSADFPKAGSQSAKLVVRILKGKPVRKVPVEYPKDLVIAVNKKTAHAIGVKLPKEIIESAGQVY